MMKKGKIDGKLVGVITPEEYYANPSMYAPNYTAFEGGTSHGFPDVYHCHRCSDSPGCT